MSFPKAPLKRFNEHIGCAPAPGSYDVKVSDGLKGPVSFEKCQRFSANKDSGADSLSVDRDDEPPSPARLRKNSFLCSTPNLRPKPERDAEFIREMKKQKTLEKQIRVLLKERAEQDKKLQLLEEDFKKIELKLVTAVREKTSLTGSIASLDRQVADLSKANELLKTKFSDDGSKRKMNSLCAELMEVKNKVDMKDKALARLEDIEHKLLQAQRLLEEALQRVTLLEGQLAGTEEERSKLVQEKAETEKILAATLEQIRDVILQAENYKLLVDQAEERLKQKEVEHKGQRDTFSQKEKELLAKVRELEDKYIGPLQEKEHLLIESNTKEKSLSAELEALKQKVSQGEGQCQTLKKKEEELRTLLEKEMDTSSALKLELQTVQEEMMKERSLLEDELEGALDEFDRLQQQEQEAEKMILHLEQVNRKRAEELARVEETLKGLQVSSTEMEHLKSTNACLLEKLAVAEDDNKGLHQHLESKIKDIQDLELHICKLKAESNQTKETLENQLLELQESLKNTEKILNGQLVELQEASIKSEDAFKQQLELQESSAKTKEGLEQQVTDLKAKKEILEQQFFELQETCRKTKEQLQQQFEFQDLAAKTKDLLEHQLYNLQETSKKTKEVLGKQLSDLQESSSKTVFELELQVLELQKESSRTRNEMAQQLEEMGRKSKETTDKEMHELNIASNKIHKELLQQLHELQESSKKTNERLEKQVNNLKKILATTEHELDERNGELESLKSQLKELQEEHLSKKSESNEEILMEASKWRMMFEELHNKVRPFQQQLDAFEAEKNAMLNKHGAAQDELSKLSDAYAKLLGHQNQKQKIKHVMKLKMENTELKQEVAKLKAQLSKEKQTEKHLQTHTNELQGVKRFDPSKAFQHDVKENVYPKAPLRDGNRNQC